MLRPENPAKGDPEKAGASAGTLDRFVRFPRGLACWARRHWQRLLVGLVFGVALHVAVHAAHHSPVVVAIENSAFDTVMWVLQGMGPPSDRRHGYVFIDLDEETYEAWGRPATVPREKLAAVLERVLTGDPALVVVDVDASRPSEGQDPLWRLLDGIGRKRRGTPPILLTVALPAHPESTPLAALPLPSGAEGPLHLTSVRFERDRDFAIRSWPLATTVCEVDRPRVLPALPMAAAVVLSAPDGRDALSRLREAVGPGPEGTCGELEPHGEHAPPGGGAGSGEFRAGALELDLRPEGVEQRIFYRIPWRMPAGFSRPRVPGTSRPELEILSAGRFAAAERDLPTNRFADSIVVIGASHAAGRDIHYTPIGAMPGALVLVNAIDSILTHGQIEPPPPPVRYGLVALEVVGVSVLFAAQPAFWALLLGVGAILVVLLPISMLWIAGGVWLDFALPLVGVFLHNLLAEYEEARHRG